MKPKTVIDLIKESIDGSVISSLRRYLARAGILLCDKDVKQPAADRPCHYFIGPARDPLSRCTCGWTFRAHQLSAQPSVDFWRGLGGQIVLRCNNGHPLVFMNADDNGVSEYKCLECGDKGDTYEVRHRWSSDIAFPITRKL